MTLTFEVQASVLCTTSPHQDEHVCPVTWELYDAWFLISTFDILSVTLTFEVQACLVCHLIMVNMCPVTREFYDAWFLISTSKCDLDL